MAEDIVRVLRIIEYVGPRSVVETQIERSMYGTRRPGNGVTIRVATIGSYPEIMEQESMVELPTAEMPDPVPFEAVPATEPERLPAEPEIENEVPF